LSGERDRTAGYWKLSLAMRTNAMTHSSSPTTRQAWGGRSLDERVPRAQDGHALVDFELDLAADDVAVVDGCGGVPTLVGLFIVGIAGVTRIPTEPIGGEGLVVSEI
jgi:hypothetical protein